MVVKMNLDGGLGDIVMFSAVARSYLIAHPMDQIKFQGPYDDLLWNNPRIHKLLRYEERTDFDKEYIMKPYERPFDPKKHWIQTICDEIETQWDGGPGEFYPAPYELTEAKAFIEKLGKPVIIIQPYAANPPLHNGNMKVTQAKDWFDDKWQELINILNKDYAIIQVGGAGEHVFDNVTNLVNMIYPRQTFSFLAHCHTWISVESFLPHAAATMGKPGVVLFGRSDPAVYGYNQNVNIIHKEACECSPCNAQFCGAERKCMQRIEINEILKYIGVIRNA